MARIDLKLCTISISDGTSPVPNTLLLKIGSGNIQWTEKRNFIYVLDRGLLGTVRRGDQEPLDVKFDIIYEFLETPSGLAPNVTPEDFLKQRGNAANYVTAGADPCMPYAVTMKIFQTQTCDVPTELASMTEFRYESLSHDLRGGMMAVTGKCNIQSAILVRS